MANALRLDLGFAEVVNLRKPHVGLLFSKGKLEELNQKSRSVDPTINKFSGLPFAQQTDVLRSVEDTPLFGAMMFMTKCGMFSLPAYGGNRDHAGWDLLGFDHQHAWQPPFGYYDAAVHGKATVEVDKL